MTPKVDKAVVEEAEEEIRQDKVDDVAVQLAQLGAELQAVANDAVARQAKLKEVEQVLGNLKVKDFPELAESPTIQQFVKLFADTTGMRPGEVKNRGSLAEAECEWTWKDMAQFPRVKFIPNETIVLTFNGLALRVVADVECEVPEPFYNIWLDYRKAKREARQHELYLMGHSDVPPDANWMTVEGAEVRAWSTQGRKFGKVSGYLGVGPIYEGEEAPSGEAAGGNA